jgi:SAM-dependent methyltransferase
VLDVGCGTGAIAAAVASATPSSRLVGIDLAAAFVAFAQARHGNERIRFEAADARRLPFADASFDRALSLLNLNFVPGVDDAIAEMSRVTRHGGTIAAAVWDYGAKMEMLRVFWDEAVALDPAADALDERHMPLCRDGELARLWAGHGLQDVAGEPLTIETRFANFDDYWRPFLAAQGPAGAYVASLPPGDRDRLEQRLRARLLDGDADGPIALRARAWAVRGTVAHER